MQNRVESLGWKQYTKHVSAYLDLPENSLVGRVTAENRGSWMLGTQAGEILGIILKTFTRSNPLPKVGDWIIYSNLPGGDRALIEKILPRFSKISRKDPRPGEIIEEQVLVVNVDKAFLVQGLDNNFNLNRMERYLVAVQEGGVEPIAVFNKLDLAEDFERIKAEIEQRLVGIKVLFASAQTGRGVAELEQQVPPGETVVFLGSSGVGKSTLINALLETLVQQTRNVREQDSRGRHTTTRREMFFLSSGGIVIDTPGMRELQVLASEEAVGDTFPDIYELLGQCRFSNCDHEKSAGCALVAALEAGEISAERLESFKKLQKEIAFSQGKNDPNYQKAQKDFWKKISKRQKEMQGLAD